jgi:hypothetical protein
LKEPTAFNQVVLLYQGNAECLALCIVLRTLLILTNSTIGGDKYCDKLHCTDKETEEEKG